MWRGVGAGIGRRFAKQKKPPSLGAFALPQTDPAIRDIALERNASLQQRFGDSLLRAVDETMLQLVQFPIKLLPAALDLPVRQDGGTACSPFDVPSTFPARLTIGLS